MKRGAFFPVLPQKPTQEWPIGPFTTLAEESVTDRVRADSYSGPGAWWGLVGTVTAQGLEAMGT